MQSKIKVLGDFDRVNEEERNFINGQLDKFIEKHDPDFNEMHLKLDCQEEKETSRGRASYVCKLNLASDNGKYNAENHDFGAEKTIVGALNKIERQIRKKL